MMGKPDVTSVSHFLIGEVYFCASDIPSVDELQSACVYAQQRLNPYLFVYAMSVVMLHRPDTRNVTFPAHVCSFPGLYIQGPVMSDVMAAATVVQSGNRVCRLN